MKETTPESAAEEGEEPVDVSARHDSNHLYPALAPTGSSRFSINGQRVVEGSDCAGRSLPTGREKAVTAFVSCDVRAVWTSHDYCCSSCGQQGVMLHAAAGLLFLVSSTLFSRRQHIQSLRLVQDSWLLRGALTGIGIAPQGQDEIGRGKGLRLRLPPR